MIRLNWRWFRSSFALFAGVGLAFAAGESRAVDAVPGDNAAGAEAVRECVQKNFPVDSSIQRVQFRPTDRLGQARTIQGKLWWKRGEDGNSKALIKIFEPADLKGAGLLLIEKDSRTDMFVYLPDLRKVKRVTSHMMAGSLFGSDFTYEDFTRIQGMAVGGRSEKLDDATLDDVAVDVVAHYPAEDVGSAYQRVVSYVEKERCIPLKSEMWESDTRLRKVLTADRDSVHEEKGVRIPLKLRMEDKKDQTATDLLIEDIELGADVSNRLFTSSSLERTQVR